MDATQSPKSSDNTSSKADLPKPLANRIHERLLALSASNRYYDYFDEPVSGMDCFADLRDKVKKDKIGLYQEHYMHAFEKHLSSALEDKNGQLRPHVSAHVDYHLSPSPRHVEAALRALSAESRLKFHTAIAHLLQHNPSKYYDLKTIVDGSVAQVQQLYTLTPFRGTGYLKRVYELNGAYADELLGKFLHNEATGDMQKIVDVELVGNGHAHVRVLEPRPDGLTCVEPVCEEVLSCAFVRLFNALECLTAQEQTAVLVHIARQQLRETTFYSQMAEMILKPNALYHGEILLMAYSALMVFDDDALHACVNFFRGCDLNTVCEFKMNL